MRIHGSVVPLFDPEKYHDENINLVYGTSQDNESIHCPGQVALVIQLLLAGQDDSQGKKKDCKMIRVVLELSFMRLHDNCHNGCENQTQNYYSAKERIVIEHFTVREQYDQPQNKGHCRKPATILT